jgi:hypothetical protein
MLLSPIDKKLFTIFALKTFVDNFLSINSRNMKRLPSDTSGYDESNKL